MINRKFIRKFGILGIVFGLGMSCSQAWDKTFLQSEKVEHKKVQFMNRYGIKLSGDLYLPKDRGSQALAALAISGPFGAVKEQSSGLYAQTMAENGFVTLAFDPSYTGESGGEPRNVASPDINTEDFSAAVDKRIKAVVTTSMYDMSRVMAKGLNDSLTKEERSSFLESLSEQRNVDAKNGKPTPGPRNLPETLEGNTSPITEEFFQYYRTPRGFHKNSPNSNGAWTATTPLSFMNMPLLSYVKEISPKPILLIAGDSAHSRYFSEDVYKAASEPKELLIVANANHVDLYDRKDKIPFDTIVSFFKENLK
ncbi:alpha/beta hydrolase [Leptospira meyeri]|uniref:alpha/beta hydrolase n=1 Tax=Leptospira meyeri TaxID=29508 RepID=UPI001FEE723D|nr:alpha/beta hydrolase [Leptospira meyeri]